ncbi:MAG: response regulator transcription factor [Syntrophus sp. (in: bacteria)]
MSISVLLVDDHAMFREGLKLLLEIKTDLQVVGQAADGREAVRMVKTLNPEMVLMDIFMPELNGIDATEQIKEFNQRIKVIILSMYATTEHVYQSFKAGADGYLLKELAGAEVIKAIRTVHAGKRYLCDNISSLMIDDYIKSREKSDEDNPLRLLSQREREVLQMLAEGKPSTKIAETLHLAPSTVETYRYRLMQKLGISDLPGLIKFALQRGIIYLK